MQNHWSLMPLVIICLVAAKGGDDIWDTPPEPAWVTLQNLSGTDPKIQLVAHPLICVDQGDFPKGRELIFIDQGTKASIHAVFPDKRTAPKDLSGVFELKGLYQGIQKKARFDRHRKDLIDNYKYFVVYSWERQTAEEAGAAPKAADQ